MSIKVTKVSPANKVYRKEQEIYVIFVRNPKTAESVLKTKGIWSAEFITSAKRYEIPEKRVKSSVLVFFNKRGPFSTTKEKVYYALFSEWLYEIRVSANESYYTGEELDILVKEKIYKDNKKFEQIKKQVEAYEKFEAKPQPERRQPIPEDVKFEVWRRDGGKCVMCGSQKNLEFDHIIPFSKGGSSTARNIQLLCQDCNRKKSNKI